MPHSQQLQQQQQQQLRWVRVCAQCARLGVYRTGRQLRRQLVQRQRQCQTIQHFHFASFKSLLLYTWFAPDSRQTAYRRQTDRPTFLHSHRISTHLGRMSAPRTSYTFRILDIYVHLLLIGHFYFNANRIRTEFYSVLFVVCVCVSASTGLVY